MLTLRVAATKEDVFLIHRLAEAIWWPTYRPYIPEQQIREMLEDRYVPEILWKEVCLGIPYVLAFRNEVAVGFTNYIPSASQPDLIRIEKLYVLPGEQGKGTGQSLLQYIEKQAYSLGKTRLQLNVNRHNSAKTFYDRQGFEVVNSVDIPYRSYVLNDYIMEKSLKA